VTFGILGSWDVGGMAGVASEVDVSEVFQKAVGKVM
jgi:hypothetical protein